MSIRNWKRKLGNLKRSMDRGLKSTLCKISPSLLLSLYPVKSVVIEPTNICNLHCPLCPTTVSKRRKGIMSFSDFLTIARNLPSSIRKVDLYFSGEPLINKDLFRMVAFLVKKNVYCSVSTNGILLGERIEEILDSGLSELIIGVDGATEDTYKKYRIGGDFCVVIENIKKIVQEKRKRELKTPLIVLQFIVMKHTEKEIGTVINLARNLKVDALSLISVSLGTHHTAEDERKRLADEFLPNAFSSSRYYVDNTGMPVNKWKYNYCPHWRSYVILWNGDITVCCFDHNGLEVYGNLLKKNFLDIWKSEERSQVIKRILFRKIKICKTCGISSGDENRYIDLENFRYVH